MSDDVPEIVFNFVPVNEILNKDPEALVDAIGICSGKRSILEFNVV
jgi:hypothetical protein